MNASAVAFSAEASLELLYLATPPQYSASAAASVFGNLSTTALNHFSASSNFPVLNAVCPRPRWSCARKSSVGRKPSMRCSSLPLESRMRIVGVHCAPKRANAAFCSLMWNRAGTNCCEMNSATRGSG